MSEPKPESERATLVEITAWCVACDDLKDVVVEEPFVDLACPDCDGPLVARRVVGGFVYVLSNPRMPGLLKIGSTTRTVDKRVSELNDSTSVPEPFRVEAWFYSFLPQEDESKVHKRLATYRLKGREFFEVDLSTALGCCVEVCDRQPSYLRQRSIEEQIEELRKLTISEQVACLRKNGGGIYVLSKVDMPGLFRVSSATQTLEGDANELNAFLVLYELEAWFYSDTPQADERKVYETLPGRRSGRVFFDADLHTVIQHCAEVCGKHPVYVRHSR
jgi:hypothetical protein